MVTTNVLSARCGMCYAQVQECSVTLLGQIEAGRWGLNTFARYPFSALSISEPDLAGALITVGQERFPKEASARPASIQSVLVQCYGMLSVERSRMLWRECNNPLLPTYICEALCRSKVQTECHLLRTVSAL